MKNANRQYEVKDLFEAAVLLSKGAELDGVKKIGSICYFIFENRDLCAEISEDYRFNKLQVTAWELKDALNKLKTLIYN